MNDFFFTHQFVKMVNRGTSLFEQALWLNEEQPMDEYQIEEKLHFYEEDDLGLLESASVSPSADDYGYSIIGELLQNANGLSRLQPTYEEWIRILKGIRLPGKALYDQGDAWENSSFIMPAYQKRAWKIACIIRGKCAELQTAIISLKSEYRLYDTEYLENMLLPRKRNGMLGKGYELEPHSYEEEQMEKAVMNGIPRESADPEAVVLEFFGKYAKPGKTPAELRDILKDIRKCKTGSGIGEILKDILDLQRISLRKFVTHEKFPLHLCEGLEKKAKTRQILYNRMHA